MNLKALLVKRLPNWKFLLHFSVKQLFAWMLGMLICHAQPILVLAFGFGLFLLSWAIANIVLTGIWISCIPIRANMDRTIWSETFGNTFTVGFLGITIFLSLVIYSETESFLWAFHFARLPIFVVVAQALLGMTLYIARRLMWVKRMYVWFYPKLELCETAK